MDSTRGLLNRIDRMLVDQMASAARYVCGFQGPVQNFPRIAGGLRHQTRQRPRAGHVRRPDGRRSWHVGVYSVQRPVQRVGDVRAMSVYLKSIPERNQSSGDSAGRGATSVSASVLARGSSIYREQCESCHLGDGRGQPPHYPPLAHNPSIEMESAVNPIRMVLNGGYPPQTAGNPRPYGMPPFAQVMSDRDVACVVTYIRVSWGNHGQPVSALEVNVLRSAALLD